MSDVIFGIHAVKSLLESDPERFIDVFVLKGREDERMRPLLNELRRLGISIQLANRAVLDNKSDGAVHQGIVARVTEAKQYDEHDLGDLLDR
ncbi:MAG: RNA methyltransferase substrate-binding domain-containing protein, partial [Plesiomonas shigelloides]